MYHPMLFLHWKQARLALLPLAVAAFALPLLSIQGLGGTLAHSREAYRALNAAELWLPLYPVLAAAIGATLALTAWNWDHQLGHVYALSLPLPRWRYVLRKMGAGMALALVPTFAFWVGAHLAASSLSLPEGLQAYPDHLTVRFLLGTLVSYALLFAAGAGTSRGTVIFVTAVIVSLFGLGVLSDLLAARYPSLEYVDLATWLLTFMVERPGPFAVFTGNWSLIDV